MEETGRSWIEDDQTLHPFYASDLSHPWREEVFSKGKEFLVKFKEDGYVSDDHSCVLYGMDEEQGEKYYNEKLALASRLLNIK